MSQEPSVSPVPLLVLGAAGHAAVVSEAAEASGSFRVMAYMVTEDSTAELIFCERRVVRGFEAAGKIMGEERRLVVAVGANAHRRRLSREAELHGFARVTVIHPAAYVSRGTLLGHGTVVLAGAVIGTGARIGQDVIVNTAATVDHDCVVGDGAHLSPGVHLGGCVTVGEGAWLGVGVSVRDRVSIGAGTIVGVGAAVVKDLPAGVVAYGNPARVRRTL